LRNEVVRKQRPHFRRNLEQAVVEQIGSDAGCRQNLPEAFLD
jgi:hypothetical protein